MLLVLISSAKYTGVSFTINSSVYIAESLTSLYMKRDGLKFYVISEDDFYVGQFSMPDGSGGVGTRFISKRYPITDGLTAGTTTQEGHKETLEPEEGSLISENDRVMIE